MNAPKVDHGPIHVTVFGATHPGRQRSENQDNLLVADLSRPTAEGGFILQPDAAPAEAPGSFDLGARGAVLLVTDGMGGAAGGAVASRMAISMIYREVLTGRGSEEGPAPDGFVLGLRRALEGANAHIHSESVRDPELHGMGTTATLAGLLGSFVYLAQVGDSRAYLVRNGSAVQLTRDQTVAQQLVDAGQLTEEEAEESEHSHRILQALGGAVTVRPVLTYHPIRRGDLLLLCSDGLSRVVRKEEIAAAVGRLEDPAALCRDLIELANSRGGPDNITVVVAHLDGDGLPDPAPDDAVCPQAYAPPEPA